MKVLVLLWILISRVLCQLKLSMSFLARMKKRGCIWPRAAWLVKALASSSDRCLNIAPC